MLSSKRTVRVLNVSYVVSNASAGKLTCQVKTPAAIGQVDDTGAELIVPAYTQHRGIHGDGTGLDFACMMGDGKPARGLATRLYGLLLPTCRISNCNAGQAPGIGSWVESIRTCPISAVVVLGANASGLEGALCRPSIDVNELARSRCLGQRMGKRPHLDERRGTSLVRYLLRWLPTPPTLSIQSGHVLRPIVGERER